MDSKPSVRKIIAYNVKKYRKLNNLTQEALAELADISNTYIANIECGQTWISDKTLERIADSLNIDIYLLFIPNTQVEINSFQKEREETISYLANKEKELSEYIRKFFCETFSTIIK